MRLLQLEYFIKIAECGSISKAAQELFISQPSLTKSIANLETEYEIKLLERTTKGVSVTEKGREFLEYAKDVVNSRKLLEDMFGKEKKNISPRLCVASQQIDFFYDILEQVCKEYNERQLTIVAAEVDRGSVLKWIKARTADIGLLVLTNTDKRTFNYEFEKDLLDVYELAVSGVYVCAAPSSPLYHKTKITISEAAVQRHVTLDLDEQTMRKICLGEMEKTIDKEQVIFCNTISACLHFMRETGALLYIPKWVCGFFRKESDIRIAPLLLDDGRPYPAVNRLAWIKRKNEKLTEPENRFVELLQTYAMQNKNMRN